jgi:hypothetical protein
MVSFRPRTCGTTGACTLVHALAVRCCDSAGSMQAQDRLQDRATSQPGSPTMTDPLCSAHAQADMVHGKSRENTVLWLCAWCCCQSNNNDITRAVGARASYSRTWSCRRACRARRERRAEGVASSCCRCSRTSSTATRHPSSTCSSCSGSQRTCSRQPGRRTSEPLHRLVSSRVQVASQMQLEKDLMTPLV